METKRSLGVLPFRIDIRPLGGHVSGPTLTLVHGNQALNTAFVTEDRMDDFLSKMGGSVGARPGDVVAFGHTHKTLSGELAPYLLSGGGSLVAVHLL